MNLKEESGKESWCFGRSNENEIVGVDFCRFYMLNLKLTSD